MVRELAACLLLCFAAVPAVSEPVTTAVGDVANSADIDHVGEQLRHRASGFVFPSLLGDMPARKVTVYAVSDVSVRYTLSGGGSGDAWMDLYIYPAEMTNSEEAAGVEAALLDSFHAKPTSLPRAIEVAGDNIASSWFAGERDGTPFLTGYYLAQRGRWQMLLRVTMPSPPAEGTVARVEAAVRAVPMDWTPSVSRQ